jgi:hypothetical protein
MKDKIKVSNIHHYGEWLLCDLEFDGVVVNDYFLRGKTVIDDGEMCYLEMEQGAYLKLQYV